MDMGNLGAIRRYVRIGRTPLDGVVDDVGSGGDMCEAGGPLTRGLISHGGVGMETGPAVIAIARLLVACFPKVVSTFAVSRVVPISRQIFPNGYRRSSAPANCETQLHWRKGQCEIHC